MIARQGYCARQREARKSSLRGSSQLPTLSKGHQEQPLGQGAMTMLTCALTISLGLPRIVLSVGKRLRLLNAVFWFKLKTVFASVLCKSEILLS